MIQQKTKQKLQLTPINIYNKIVKKTVKRTISMNFKYHNFIARQKARIYLDMRQVNKVRVKNPFPVIDETRFKFTSIRFFVKLDRAEFYQLKLYSKIIST